MTEKSTGGTADPHKLDGLHLEINENPSYKWMTRATPFGKAPLRISPHGVVFHRSIEVPCVVFGLRRGSQGTQKRDDQLRIWELIRNNGPQ